jgi:hypothetical protein
VAAQDHRRPDLNRWPCDERLSQPNVAEVVVQMRPSSTVQSITGGPNARPALAPRTGAPEVGMSLRLLKFSGGSIDDYAICRSS